jgi:GT2 family glycosyltransferase
MSAESIIHVVIVTYKSARLTVKCLASIERERAVSGLNIHAIVIDNASGDMPEISDAVTDHNWSAWISLIIAPRNGGFAYGNNIGIAHAYRHGRPRYIHLLNPDTEVRPGGIANLVTFMESHHNIGIAGSLIENPDGSDWPIAFRFPSLRSELAGGFETRIVSRLLKRWEVAQHMDGNAQPVDWVCGASMMIRPEVIEMIGGLDENYFLYFEETDFCFRAKSAGFSTWYVPQSRVMHIVGQSTKVTERIALKRRLPKYWFESRRRYFATTRGISRTALIDAVSALAHVAGLTKRFLLGSSQASVPHFIRDLCANSIVWRSNRYLPAVQTFRPPSANGPTTIP